MVRVFCVERLRIMNNPWELRTTVRDYDRESDVPGALGVSDSEKAEALAQFQPVDDRRTRQSLR